MADSTALEPCVGAIAYNQDGRIGLLVAEIEPGILWRGTDLMDPLRPWRGYPRMVSRSFADLLSILESVRGSYTRQEQWAMERLHSVRDLHQIWEIWRPVKKGILGIRLEG